MGTNRASRAGQQQDDQSNTIKDPNEWTTGDEPMTGAQRSYLKTLSDEAKEPFDAGLSIEFGGWVAMIENVRNGSPAEEAGLSAGDWIVSIAGREVTKDWLKTLARHKPGDSVPITVRRDRRTIKANIVLKEVERFEYRIEENQSATPQQKALRNAWLRGTRN